MLIFKNLRSVVLTLAVICGFLSSVPSYGEPLHLELAPDHKEVLYLSEEEIESLILEDSLEVVVPGEVDSEVLLASGGLIALVGTAVLPRVSGKVLAGVRFLGGSKGQKVLVVSVASAIFAGSLLKMQGEEDFLDLGEKKSLFPTEGGQPGPPQRLVPPLSGKEDGEESLSNLIKAEEDQLKRLKKEEEMVLKLYNLRLENYAYGEGISKEEVPEEERLRIIQEIVLEGDMNGLSSFSQSHFANKIVSGSEKKEGTQQQEGALSSRGGEDGDSESIFDQKEEPSLRACFLEQCIWVTLFSVTLPIPVAALMVVITMDSKNSTLLAQQFDKIFRSKKDDKTQKRKKKD